MIFTKDCGKIPVWLLTVPCEENNDDDDDGEGENSEERRRLWGPLCVLLAKGGHSGWTIFKGLFEGNV